MAASTWPTTPSTASVTIVSCVTGRTLPQGRYARRAGVAKLVRRARLKIGWPLGHTGSSPVPGIRCCDRGSVRPWTGVSSCSALRLSARRRRFRRGRDGRPRRQPTARRRARPDARRRRCRSRQRPLLERAGALGYALRRAEATRDRVLRERDGCRTDRTLGSRERNPHRPALRRAQLRRLLERQRRRCRRRLAARRRRDLGLRAPPSAQARSSFGVYSGLAKHGVTIPGGSCPTVGIAGLALGGGVGYSSRRFGTTADNLRRLRIVTADGELLVCDASHHADLFWACRGGGGGNFGIVTDLTFATHPVSTVSTYSIEWPWAQAAQALDRVAAFAPHAPDALFSVLDLIATDPATPGARAHVVVGWPVLRAGERLSRRYCSRSRAPARRSA